MMFGRLAERNVGEREGGLAGDRLEVGALAEKAAVEEHRTLEHGLREIDVTGEPNFAQFRIAIEAHAVEAGGGVETRALEEGIGGEPSAPEHRDGREARAFEQGVARETRIRE
jgi:hypothetical protein